MSIAINTNEKIKRVVVAYSGGLDTSAIMPWLAERYGCELIAFVADVGQGSDELDGIREKAMASGAIECVIADLKQEFIEDFVFPTLCAGAVYEGGYLLGTAIARPVIAKAMVQVAKQFGADAIAHGCTGKGNDQVRFESAVSALAPELSVIAPWRIWEMRSRQELLDYLDERGISCAASATKIYSRDANLLHISHEGGAIEDLWNPPPSDAWMRTADLKLTPDEPALVTLGFEKGFPVSLDGKQMPGHELVAALNTIAGEHGVGRLDIVENRLVGMKSRGLYETPGGTVITTAHRALEQITLDRESLHFREQLGLRFADLVYDGRWFTPLREAIWASVQKLAEPMTGEVVVELFKGHARAIQRQSPNSLYSESFATFGGDDVYDQTHAEGFIRLLSLPERIRAMRAEQGKVS